MFLGPECPIAAAKLCEVDAFTPERGVHVEFLVRHRFEYRDGRGLEFPRGTSEDRTRPNGSCDTRTEEPERPSQPKDAEDDPEDIHLNCSRDLAAVFEPFQSAFVGAIEERIERSAEQFDGGLFETVLIET